MPESMSEVGWAYIDERIRDSGLIYCLTHNEFFSDEELDKHRKCDIARTASELLAKRTLARLSEGG